MPEFLRMSCSISTYIGAFGIWRDDFYLITNLFPELAWKNSLGHVDCLFRLFELGHHVVIHNKKTSNIVKPVRHGGYDIGKVFIDEYLRLCRRSLAKGLIDQRALLREIRRSILYSCSWFNNQILYPDLYSFNFDDFFQKVRAACAGTPVLLIQFSIYQRSDYILKYIRKRIKSSFGFLIVRMRRL